MTQIRPFCGLRPVPEYAAEIAALPYDVMDTEEARQILNKNPLSFLRVTKIGSDDVGLYRSAQPGSL